MEITITKNGDSDWMEFVVNKDKISAYQEFNRAFLRKFFSGKPLCLITIEPMRSSIGHEFSNGINRKIGKTWALVSFLDILTEEAANDICESQDYWLGLLLILENKGQVIDEDYLSLIDVLDFRKGELSNSFKDKLLFCSEDGKKINLINSGVSTQLLAPIIAEFGHTSRMK